MPVGPLNPESGALFKVSATKDSFDASRATVDRGVVIHLVGSEGKARIPGATVLDPSGNQWPAGNDASGSNASRLLLGATFSRWVKGEDTTCWRHIL